MSADGLSLKEELTLRVREWFERESRRMGLDKVVTAKLIVVLELEPGSEPEHIVAKLYERAQHDELLGALPEERDDG